MANDIFFSLYVNKFMPVIISFEYFWDGLDADSGWTIVLII